MNRLTIHNVESIELTDVAFYPRDKHGDKFYTREIEVTDTKGQIFGMVLFSDNKDNLEII